MAVRKSGRTSGRPRLMAVRKSRFSPESIERFKVPKGKARAIQWGEHGLGLRHGARSKVWVACYRITEGTPPRSRLRWISYGEFPEVSPSLARQRHLEAVNQRRDGVDPAAVVQAQKARRAEAGSFGELAAEYLRLHVTPTLRPSTAAEYERLLRVEVLPKWAHLPARAVTKAQVRDLVDEIAVARRKRTAAARTLAVIKALYSWAVDRDAVDANPAAGVRSPDPKTRRERALGPDELAAVLRGLATTGTDRAGAAVRLALLFAFATAARSGEIRGARWSELSLRERVWLLPAPRNKSGRDHRIPLSSFAIDILRQSRETFGLGPFVFPALRKVDDPSQARPMYGSALNQALARLAPAWGFTAHPGEPFGPFCVHDIRRSAASGMAASGVRYEVVEKVLGHRLPVLVETYQLADRADEVRAALESWGARLQAILNESREEARP